MHDLIYQSQTRNNKRHYRGMITLRKGILIILTIILVLSIAASCKNDAAGGIASPEFAAPEVTTDLPVVSTNPTVTGSTTDYPAPAETPDTTPAPPIPAQPLSFSDTISRLWSRIDGSTATIPLTAAIYDALNTGRQSAPFHNATSRAYRNLIYGDVTDLIFVTYPSAGEFEMASAYGVDLEIIPVVKDALVFLVNVENPVNDVSISQLREVYTGRTTDWSELGGNDESIIAYQRNSGSGSQTLFLKLLMGDLTPMDAPSEWVPAEMDSLVNAISNYSNSSNAIGYSMFYYVNNMYGNDRFKLLGVNGVKPSPETIESGDYLLEDYYYAVMRKDTPEDSPMRELVKWLLSDEGQALAFSAGYIPVRHVEGALPSNSIDPVYLGDTRNSSGTGGTVLKSGVEDAQPVNGVRRSLSDLFYDGFNYILYINDAIMQELDHGFPEEVTRPLFEEIILLKQPFTGIPNDYPNFEITGIGWLIISFPIGNPFFVHSRDYYSDYSFDYYIRLTDDISPYGGAKPRFSASISYDRRILPRVDLFVYNISIPDNPEVAGIINKQLKDWTDSFPGSGVPLERLNIFLGEDRDWEYYLRPYSSLWRNYLEIAYPLNFYDGGGLGTIYSICFDIETGSVVNLLDFLPDDLDLSKARVVRIVDWDTSEYGYPMDIWPPDDYTPAEGSVITGAGVSYSGLKIYLAEPGGRALTLSFADNAYIESIFPE